jgi:hypothetical protein
LAGSGATPPLVLEAATHFTWQDTAITAAGADRLAEVTSPTAAVTLTVSAEVTTSLGLFAVDPLRHPTLNGVTLAISMPTESAFTIQPDGSALFTYWDIFDPKWRAREPGWKQEVIDGQTFTVDRLQDDPVPAKVARDADISRAENLLYLLDKEGQVSFYFSGELRYCFYFGRPVQAFQLSDPGGSLHTVLETPPGFKVRLSSDDVNWQTVWTSTKEGAQQPDVSLPAALQGAKTLCVSFQGNPGDMITFRSLYVTARIQDPALATLAHFPAGEPTILFTDDPASSHRATLFWDAPQVQRATAAVPLPDAPKVEETPDSLRLLFPGAFLDIPRAAGGAPGAISRLVVGQHTVLEAAPGQTWTPTATLTMLDGAAKLFPADLPWADYRNEYLAKKQWRSLWSRSQRKLSLEDAHFEGAQVVGQEIALTWTVTDAGQSGVLTWLFSPEETTLAGQTFSGVGMRVRVSGAGLAKAERIKLSFPLRMARNDWQVAQLFRMLAEDPFTFQGSPRYPDTMWFGTSQSFVFRTGLGRTVLGLFESPVSANVRLSEEGGRQVYDFDIPLGAGETRETPKLLWLVAPRGAADRWAANDIWAQVFEAIKTGYSADAGVLASRPVPSVVWNLPLEADVISALQHLVDTGKYPGPGEGWFDWYAQNQLPRAEDAGIRNVIIQPPWTSDAEDPKLVASLHAPRDLVVSKLWGGEEALGRLVADAHSRGVKVTLWYPSATSLYSSISISHTDWLAWKLSGVPEDAGWGDIVGLDTRGAYFQYAVDKITALHKKVPFDGLWMDSWQGLTVLTNYAAAQPSPQLDTAIALQRAFTKLGISELLIEGLGPLGRPDAYGDYETYTGPPKPTPTQVQELERLRNHEYLLYRMGAGTYIDMAIYHRTLAAGGIINIANFDEIDDLKEEKTWLKRINLEHRQVVESMQHRKLLVADGRWLGVAWSRDGSDELVIFAFDQPFRYRPDAPTCAKDVSEGNWMAIDGELTTQPWRTYLIRPGSACHKVYLPTVVR